MRHHVVSEEGAVLRAGLRRARREGRGEPRGGVTRPAQRARQPAQRELHVVRGEAPPAVFVHLGKGRLNCTFFKANFVLARSTALWTQMLSGDVGMT